MEGIWRCSVPRTREQRAVLFRVKSKALTALPPGEALGPGAACEC